VFCRAFERLLSRYRSGIVAHSDGYSLAFGLEISRVRTCFIAISGVNYRDFGRVFALSHVLNALSHVFDRAVRNALSRFRTCVMALSSD